MEITVKKTTYEVEGIQEPCFEVSNGYAMVRIATCYHYLGSNTLYLTEYLDGEYNGSDEWDGDFEELSMYEARKLAKEFSAYL